MATITSAATGLASATATWVGAVVPVEGDKVIIDAGHVITLDGTFVWGDDNMTATIGTAAVSVSGTLTASRSVSSSLTVRGLLLANFATKAFDFGTDASPIPNGITARLILNKAATPSARRTLEGITPTDGAGNFIDWTFVGDSSRVKGVTLNSTMSAAATSFTLTSSAHNWQVGDEVLFFATNNAATVDECESRTITVIAGAVITVGAAVTYAHLAGSPVCNLTCNVIVESFNAVSGQMAFDIRPRLPGYLNTLATAGYYVSFKNTLFRNIGNPGINAGVFNAAATVPTSNYGLIVQGCVFRNLLNDASIFNIAPTKLFTLNNCVAYMNGAPHFGAGNMNSLNSYFAVYNMLVSLGSTHDGDWITMRNTNDSLFPTGCTVKNSTVSGRGTQLIGNSNNGLVLDTCDLGLTYGFSTLFATDFLYRLAGVYYNLSITTLKDCLLDAGSLLVPDDPADMAIQLDGFQVDYVNKGRVVTAQERYTNRGEIKRNNSTTRRSTSSISIKPIIIAKAAEKTQSILCANGSSIRIVGSCQFDSAFNNTGSYTSPTVTISGLGVTPVVYTATAAANGAWEIYNITATNSSGADGNFTLTFSVTALAVVTGTVFFDGVPDAPYITKCRHYGFMFDESNPSRVTNITTSAAEADAAAYTGMTVTWGASASSVSAISADQTFQRLYDYTQAQGCLNIPSAMPLTGVGVAGAPSLFAVGNVTVNTGFKINGSGSLSMGSYTLTAPGYTYTGGTFSQAASTASYSGGQLNIGAAGSFTFIQAAAMILSMTPTAPGTYVLGGSTFTGQVDLRNVSAHAITVELPSGTSSTTANNTGGVITVSTPTTYANISVTGMPDVGAVPTRLQIFNSTAAAAVAWAASTAYATNVIRRRTTGIGSENTAGLYMRATTGGTSGATEPTWNTTVGGTTADGSVVWTTYSVLYYDLDPASTSYATTYIDGKQFLSGETVKVRFAEMNGATSFKRYSTTVIAAASGFSADVDETADEVYATNALDGAAYETTFSPNFTLNYIVLDTNTDFSGKAAYAYFCYTLTTSNGMYKFWGGVTALDSGNYRIETDVLNLYFDETLGFVKQTDDVRIFRKDGLRPALDPTTGLNGIEINWRTPVNVISVGGSALTSAQAASLGAIESKTSSLTYTGTALQADMRKTVGQDLKGDGTAADKFRSTLVT